MLDRVRVTLAMRFVLPDDDTVTVLDLLLQRVTTLGLHITRLFLDTGFASTAVMAYLTHRQQPALIACPIRGRRGGTRALCQGQRSSRTTYTFSGQDTGPFTAELAVCRVCTTAQRTQRMQRRAAWLIFILIHLELAPRRARRLYRRRFGIESS